MEWNENNIQEAISKSKLTKSLFVVLTEDDNTSDGETWANEKLNQLVKENKCVMVRLKAHSPTAAQFNQIYPVSIFPTVHFIGNNGKPLEVKAGPTTASELINIFNKTIQIHKSSIVVSEGAHKSDVVSETSTHGSPSKQPQTSSNNNYDGSVSGDQCNASERNQKSKIDIEIEEARKVKNKEYQALKDKLKAKEDLKKGENMKEKQEKEITKWKKTAMIQFKFPDGSSVVKAFEAEDGLDVAKQFVIEHLQGRVKSLKLWQLRPRVLIDDLEKTFLDYNLVPSAVLVVLFDTEEPKSQTVNSNGLFALWAKFIVILQYFLSWIIPSSPNQPSLSSSSNSLSSSPPNASPSTSSTPAARPKSSSQKSGIRQRKEGNIHRLTADDEDDDQATWNGNSTQQM